MGGCGYPTVLSGFPVLPIPLAIHLRLICLGIHHQVERVCLPAAQMAAAGPGSEALHEL